ncbi:hypothetical protein Tco_0913011 [Tanacetum coccineum]
MEQLHQVIPADQLVSSKYQTIGRCNNYAVLPNIMCPKECKIVGQLLVDHALSYALTATVDVPAVVYVRERPIMRSLTDDRERDEITEATILSLTMHKTALAVEAQENVAKVQEKLMEEDIEKIVDGEDEESYASEFANSVFLNEEEDFGTRLEPGSHKENPETVDDDDDDEEEKKDDKKDDDNDDDDKDNDNNDHTDHTLLGTQVTSSLEDKNEKMP